MAEVPVDTAYRSELARLCGSVPGLLRSRPADRALRAGLELFGEYMTTKRGMADALRMVIASGGDPFAEPAQRAQAGRLVDLLMDGLRYGANRGCGG